MKKNSTSRLIPRIEAYKSHIDNALRVVELHNGSNFYQGLCDLNVKFKLN